MQSHVHLGVFFENPRKQLDTKEFSSVHHRAMIMLVSQI